jgi:hypothetical protein
MFQELRLIDKQERAGAEGAAKKAHISRLKKIILMDR